MGESDDAEPDLCNGCRSVRHLLHSSRHQRLPAHVRRPPRLSVRRAGLLYGLRSGHGRAHRTDEVVKDALPETTDIPADWAAGVEDTGYVDDGWVASFGDTRLERLVDEAIQNNLDLRLAASQVERAAGLAQLAGSSLKPTIGIGGDAGGRAAGREVMDTNLFSGWTYGASLAMSWELDVWGKLRARAQAGEESLAATVADFEYARQSIAATITKTYFLATAARQQLELAEEAVELFKEIVEIVEAKQEVGQVSQQDVYLAEADLASAQEARELAQSGYEQVQRALEVLLGRYPSAAIPRWLSRALTCLLSSRRRSRWAFPGGQDPPKASEAHSQLVPS